MNFIPAMRPALGDNRPAWWFVFRDDRLLVRFEDGTLVRPYLTDLSKLKSALIRKQYLGSLNGTDCYTAELTAEAPVPEDAVFKGLRQLFGAVDEELLWIAGRANQFVHWAQTHQFCGRCGRPTRDKTDERAKICVKCGLINYPRVSPAIIVAVVRKDKILLARSTRFRSSFYSVLAGFVEPGETLEECVGREVFEEVGIRVKNVRYFGNQPWPFPNSLMVAFTAEYAGGEISADESEIVTAGWFSAEELPRVPGKFTIARQLIDWFVRTQNRQ